MHCMKQRVDKMKTTEIINTACSKLGTTKAELGRRHGAQGEEYFEKASNGSFQYGGDNCLHSG